MRVIFVAIQFMAYILHYLSYMFAVNQYHHPSDSDVLNAIKRFVEQTQLNYY